MSQIEEIILESTNETLEEGMLKDLLTAGLVSGSMLMGSPSVADAKTNFNRLHPNHEITAKYEHGGKGNSAITKDNYGGYSYGKNQISTERRNGRPSTFDFFMDYAKEHLDYAAVMMDLAGGHDAAYKGTEDFKNLWKKLCEEEDFNRLYDNFILDSQIATTYKKMDMTKDADLDKVTTWATSNEAVQSAVQSAIIQHGMNGAQKLISHTMGFYKPKNPRSFIHELYKARGVKYPKYKNRYKNEEKDVISYYDSLTAAEKAVKAKKK